MQMQGFCSGYEPVSDQYVIHLMTSPRLALLLESVTSFPSNSISLILRVILISNNHFPGMVTESRHWDLRCTSQVKWAAQGTCFGSTIILLCQVETQGPTAWVLLLNTGAPNAERPLIQVSGLGFTKTAKNCCIQVKLPKTGVSHERCLQNMWDVCGLLHNWVNPRINYAPVTLFYHLNLGVIIKRNTTRNCFHITIEVTWSPLQVVKKSGLEPSWALFKAWICPKIATLHIL